MTEKAITLHLPERLYEQLAEAAEAAQQTLDTVVLQSIRTGLPPSLDRLPERFRADLRALSRLSDGMLWQIARSEMNADRVAAYEALLERNQRGELDDVDKVRLSTLREEADPLMPRRSFAYALLKWRGQRIPTLSELQSP
jgi:hypothetical protein